MTWTDKLFRRWGVAPKKSERFRPAAEPLEAREVPAMLQGFAFTDAGPAGFDPSDAPRVGATVTLFDQGGIFVGTRTTDAAGYYQFANLSPGTYKLVESAAGVGTAAAQAKTAFSAATVNADRSISVTIPGTVQVARQPGLPGVASAYELAGAPFNAFTSTPSTTNAHQFLLNLTSAASPTPQAVYSFCVDLYHPDPQVFGTTVSDTPSVPGLATNAGRIGYLYSTFGNQALSPTDGTGLQLAIYELLYDATPNLFGGNFKVLNGTDFAALDSASNFLNVSAGKSLGVTFLNVSNPGPGGQQGMIAAEFFNFLNAPTSPPPTAGLGDFVWRDTNRDGIQDAGEPGVNGVPVELKVNGQVVATTTTANSPTTGQPGYYQFVGLTPGVEYQVCFTAPSGFTFTASFVGEDAFDSNVNMITGAEGCTPTVVLAPGEFNPTIDAGLVTVSPPPPPGFSVEKSASATQAAPNAPVTYTYRVTNTGSGPITNVTVRDDNATPTFAADDFTPTRLPDEVGNNDNVLDAGEVWKFTATVIPPVVMTVTTTTGGPVLASGTLSYVMLPNGDVRVFYLQDANFNDNTYGTGSDAGWTSQGKTHTFNNLVGSDKAGFLVKYADGTTLVQFYQDYITSGGTNTEGYAAFSGYQSLGYAGGDGSLVAGNGAVLTDFDSTLEWNLNQAGTANNGVAYKSMTVNSPVGDPNWNVVNGYAFTISAAAFAGGKAFGGVTIFDQHNSPAKVGGSNSYVPKVVSGPSTNRVVVTGVAGGVTLTASAAATVQVGTGGGGTTGPTKFLVVDRSKDTTYGYTAAGGATTQAKLGSGNSDPRGVAANAAGTTYWVIDQDKTVYVYDAAGASLGSWKPSGLDTPEDITTDGTNIWIVDAKKDKVFYYAGAAALRGGSAAPTSSFALAAGNLNGTGVVTDGQSLWVVDDAATDKVFKYTTAGALLGSWTLDAANSQPRGLTIDPNNVNDIWVVDNGKDAVFRYAGATALTSGSRTATDQFALVDGAGDPQGIADPPPPPLAVPVSGGSITAGFDRSVAAAADRIVTPAADLVVTPAAARPVASAPAVAVAERLPVIVAERAAAFDTSAAGGATPITPKAAPAETDAAAAAVKAGKGVKADAEPLKGPKAQVETWGLGLDPR